MQASIKVLFLDINKIAMTALLLNMAFKTPCMAEEKPGTSLLNADKAVEKSQKSAEAYLASAQRFVKMKDYKKALNDCSQALVLEPKNSRIYETRALCQELSGNYQAAVQDLKIALNLSRQQGSGNTIIPVAETSLQMEKGKPGSGFAGSWKTLYGKMTLTQRGNEIAGVYDYQGERQRLQGKVSGNCLDGSYSQPKQPDPYKSGKLKFFISPDGGNFTGQWWDRNGKLGGVWHGARIN